MLFATGAALVVGSSGQQGGPIGPSPVGTEWVLQRFRGPEEDNSGLPAYYTTQGPALADKCFNPRTGVGAQQKWKKLTGEFCFQITAEVGLTDPCTEVCTVKVFCSRGVESGTKLRFYQGSSCSYAHVREIAWQEHLTWPELSSLLTGSCQTKSQEVHEKFVKPFDIGIDFPNCTGYDFSTAGAGIVTSDPKDSPYFLRLYEDSACSSKYVPTLANSTNLPTWSEQRWMSAYRKVDTSRRTENLEHCWHIESGTPPLSFYGSLKLDCRQMIDARMAFYVDHYDDTSCLGGSSAAPTKSEIFYGTMGYEDLASSQSSVEDVKDLFQGRCIAFGQDGLYWKFDRAVFEEDWPDCYQLAIEERIDIERPKPSDLDYTGDVGVYRRKPSTSSSERHACPGYYFALGLMALFHRLLGLVV